MFGKLRLTTDTGIGRIVVGRVRRGSVAGRGRNNTARPVVWRRCYHLQRRLAQIGRRQHPFLKPGIGIVARLGGADGRHTRYHDDLVGGRKLHDLARCQERPRRFLP